MFNLGLGGIYMNCNDSFNILTFDGGGVKGALSINILQRIQDHYPSFLDKASLIGGTSTGSFIALGLAYGISIEQLMYMYSFENSSYIFSKTYPEIRRSKYDNSKLKEILLKVFPEDLRLKDLSKYVIIPTFYIGDENNTWKPIFYNNLPDSDNADALVIDVALASSAAPIFFPIYKNHIDGGIVANDPSLACLIHIIDNTVNQNLKNIKLLSIGTGYAYTSLKSEDPNWSAIDWVIGKNPSHPIISVILEGNSQISQTFTSKLLYNNYIRINPRLDYSISLDDYSELEYLSKLGKECNIDDVSTWIGEKWN